MKIIEDLEQLRKIVISSLDREMNLKSFSNFNKF